MKGSGSGRDDSSLKGVPLAERYELLEEIGHGGFAQVWKARDRKLGRTVAVKRLKTAVLGGAEGKRTLERFSREAGAIAQLNHRNIVQVYDHDADAEGHYVVMELVEGGTLRDYLKSKKDGKLAEAEAVEIVKGIAQGLGCAHKKNLVHRDIKPSNVLLAFEGSEAVPKIVDFGLARMGSDSELSVSGYGMGTPYYMPPEQRRDAKSVNHTADIYALGKVLYELCSGELPDIVDPDKISPALAKIVLNCVKTKPEERYFSTDELIGALDRLAETQGARRLLSGLAKKLGDRFGSCGKFVAALGSLAKTRRARRGGGIGYWALGLGAAAVLVYNLVYNKETTLWTIVGLLPVGLALPPALREKSWKRFGKALALYFLGVVLPVLIFFVSALFVPGSKVNCSHGWLDCFYCGKLALLPFVLWASVALYAVDILKVKNRKRRWIVLGISLGALVSTVCLVFETIMLWGGPREKYFWVLVPLYVATWYVIRAVQLARESQISCVAYLVSFCSSIPFWIGSVVWSRRSYLALPDQAPDCFVVTAATQGHARLVGPFTEVRRNGQPRMANRQLMTFWGLEGMWSQQHPVSHTCFRALYNRLGPILSRRIRYPYAADMVYLILKPVEVLGWFVLAMERRSKTAKNRLPVTD